MDTKDISTITAVSSPQIPSCPTAFLGHTLQEIWDWFDENIVQPYSWRESKYMQDCFIVLDDKTLEDDSCMFVSTEDSAPGAILSVRCTFDVVVGNVEACDLNGETIDDDTMGGFFESGVTMTKENAAYWLMEEGLN